METITAEIETLKQSIGNGEVDPLRGFIHLKRAYELIKVIMDEIKEEAVSEAEKYNEKEFKVDGVSVGVKSGAGRWSYKGISDWDEAKGKLSEIEERHKTAYKMIGKGDLIVDGEIVQPAKFMPGATTLAISFKKETV